MFLQWSVVLVETDLSVKHAASVFRVKVEAQMFTEKL
jgi:hypothetical protein